MSRDREGSVERQSIGRAVHAARESAGLSRAELAQACGLKKRRIDAIEHGRVVTAAHELRSIAVACEVDFGSLVPPGYGLTLTPGGAARRSTDQLQGGEALDALLREYVSMVLELRSVPPEQLASIRQQDLTELARALGGTPEAIEARLTELLGTTDRSATTLRETILPSTNAAWADWN
jgi:transcriptional regulator with XRE-family HTH domain